MDPNVVKTESYDVRSLIRNRVRQISKSRVDLEVTPVMRIGVYVYIKTKPVSLPSLKKVDASNDGPVKQDRTFFRPDDPDVVVHDKISALRYGGEYVAIPKEEKDAMKFVSEKCLKVIGFFSKSVFPPQYLMSSADCVAAEPENVHAAIALSSLIHGLIETDEVMLCRFSFRANAEPRLVVLFPHVEQAFECFYSVQVPYAEDSRENSLLFPPLPVASDALLSAMDQLIDLRAMSSDVLVPEYTLNPTLARFWATVDARVKNSAAPIAPLDMDPVVYSEKYIFGNEKDFMKSTKKIKQLAGGLSEHFPDAEEEKRKKKYWREIQEKEFSSPVKASVDVKKIRIA